MAPGKEGNPGKVYFDHDEIQERPNKRFPAADPFTIHYHFRPARPANLCVTLDRDTGEVNVSAGTLGPLTWNPYTMCLHISRGSPHTYNNLYEGGECVVALPGKDIVKETWITALPLPRGISEAEVAGLTEFPSRHVKVPGIAECPVNFECVVEFKKDYYTHAIVFVRVLGASIDEKVLGMDREAVVRWYPTYEVDDVANEFGGSVERLGVMGEILECPRFPLAPKAGWYQSFDRWMTELREEGFLTPENLAAILALAREYNTFPPDPSNPRRSLLREIITALAKLIVNKKWTEISPLLARY
jgi:flavin reductase (DIM6/NTAB) family NADH-FMN oxidoreductase RutF